MFGRRIHPLKPQRVGLSALSRRGVDFAQGGTCFETEGAVVDIERDHEFGDIALFRFDIPHWVNPLDLRDKFTWEFDAGRWSWCSRTTEALVDYEVRAVWKKA